MNHDNIARAGWVWTIEASEDGKVINTQKVHNLFPIEGLNNMLGVWLKGVTQPSNFYVGLFEGNYTPVPGDTAAGFPAAATELTTYDETTRVLLELGDVAAGAVDNSADRAVFTGSTNGKSVTGGFITTAPAKGATTGVLASAVRFSSPQSFNDGTILRVTCSFQIVSL